MMVHHSSTQPPKTPQWNALLHEFQATFAPALSESNLIEQQRRLLTNFGKVHADWKKEQVAVAVNFNILRTMRLTRKELCHSDILAWLLDHHVDGLGTHSQGKLGFRLFLQQLDLPLRFAETDYRVIREASGQESRIDITIEAERQFLIGIENKVDSGEGEDQTRREWNDLKRRGKQLHLPPCKVEAFFLTPGEQKPSCAKFKAISWKLIADLFELFAAQAKPTMVKLFAQHYADTLRHDVVLEIEPEEKDYENTE